MRIFRWLSLMLAFGFSGAELHATILTPLLVEELGERAELILHGTVTGMSCLRSPVGRIFTRVELQVREVWKGALTNRTVCIVHSGGTVGNLRTAVSGQVRYEVGEEVVAFLVVNSRGEGVTLGLAQGKFNVWQDPKTGEKFSHNLIHGATERAAAGEKASERLSLKELGRRAKTAKR